MGEEKELRGGEEYISHYLVLPLHLVFKREEQALAGIIQEVLNLALQ